MATQTSIQHALPELFDSLIHFIENDISVAKICKVVKYDKKKHLADLLPLANNAFGEVSAQLCDVPVAKSCYQTDELVEKLKPEFKSLDKNEKIKTSLVKALPKKAMKKGAIVIVLMLDNDNDSWSGTNTFTPDTTRQHDINDGIVIGVIK